MNDVLSQHFGLPFIRSFIHLFIHSYITFSNRYFCSRSILLYVYVPWFLFCLWQFGFDFTRFLLLFDASVHIKNKPILLLSLVAFDVPQQNPFFSLKCHYNFKHETTFSGFTCFPSCVKSMHVRVYMCAFEKIFVFSLWSAQEPQMWRRAQKSLNQFEFSVWTHQNEHLTRYSEQMALYWTLSPHRSCHNDRFRIRSNLEKIPLSILMEKYFIFYVTLEWNYFGFVYHHFISLESH